MNKSREMGDEEKGREGDVASHLPVLVRQSDVSVGVLFFLILLFLPHFHILSLLVPKPIP